MSDSNETPKDKVIRRLKISLSLLVACNEYIPVQDVAKKHDELFNPSLKEVIRKANFATYADLFKIFPNTFIVSEDGTKVAFTRSPQPSILIPYTHLCAGTMPSNIRVRAWKSVIFVRKLGNNHVIEKPLHTSDVDRLAIPERILLNLKKMIIYKNATRLTCIQQVMFPYFLDDQSDILIEGTKGTGRTTCIITSILTLIHLHNNITRKRSRGLLAVILLQSSPYETCTYDDDTSVLYADYFCKTLRLLSEHLNIKIGFDGIDTSMDLCVVTFKDIHEYNVKDLADLKFFAVMNVDRIIAKVGRELFVARITPFSKDARSIFVMEDYNDPGPIMLRDLFKPDAVFISDKS